MCVVDNDLVSVLVLATKL